MRDICENAWRSVIFYNTMVFIMKAAIINWKRLTEKQTTNKYNKHTHTTYRCIDTPFKQFMNDKISRAPLTIIIANYMLY